MAASYEFLSKVAEAITSCKDITQLDTCINWVESLRVSGRISEDDRARLTAIVSKTNQTILVKPQRPVTDYDST